MEQISRNSLAVQVAELIQQRIHKSKLQPGDELGTEVKFAEEFGVSRNIVREAIGRLKGLGIVEGKQRTGLVVGKTDPVHLFDQGLPLFLINEPINLSELSKMRYVLEIGAIDLAVKNATDEQIKKMKELANRMATMQEQSKVKKITLLEEEFHSLILQATGSSFLTRMHVVISRYFINASTHIDNYDLITTKSILEHQQIAEAFENRDENKIRHLLQNHLQMILYDETKD